MTATSWPVPADAEGSAYALCRSPGPRLPAAGLAAAIGAARRRDLVADEPVSSPAAAAAAASS